MGSSKLGKDSGGDLRRVLKESTIEIENKSICLSRSLPVLYSYHVLLICTVGQSSLSSLVEWDQTSPRFAIRLIPILNYYRLLLTGGFICDNGWIQSTAYSSILGARIKVAELSQLNCWTSYSQQRFPILVPPLTARDSSSDTSGAVCLERGSGELIDLIVIQVCHVGYDRRFDSRSVML